MEVCKQEESEEKATVLVGMESPEEPGMQQRGLLQECKLPRVLSLEKKSGEHLKWTHWEKVQHCTDLPHQVTFPAHTEQRKTGQGLGRTFPLIRKRIRMRRRAREKRQILKKLRAALQRKFRGQQWFVWREFPG